MLRPFFSVPIRMAPRRAPRTSPRPPKRLTPPITAAAIAFKSRLPGGNVSATELTWAAKMIPPIAAIAPEIANTRMRTRDTLMPARRAASALPPTAYTWRPNVVHFARNVSSTKKKTMITPASGRPRGVVMTLPLLQIATVPKAAIPMPIVFRMAEVQLCWQSACRERRSSYKGCSADTGR